MVLIDVSYNGSTNVRVDGYIQESIKSEILKKWCSVLLLILQNQFSQEKSSMTFYIREDEIDQIEVFHVYICTPLMVPVPF